MGLSLSACHRRLKELEQSGAIERYRAVVSPAAVGLQFEAIVFVTISHTDLLGGQKASTRDRIVPYTVFIDPQLGRVGMSEREAMKQNRAIRVAKLPMSAVIRAIETGETRGFMKVVVDRDSDAILGAAILGVGGDEAIHGVIEAMAAGVTATAYMWVMAIHPTVSELVPTTFGELSP